MKSRVITLCVLIFCSELVASIPYPEDLASLLRAFSTSGASSENEFSNLEIPSVARSQRSSATSSGSLEELLKSKSFQKTSSNYDQPLDLSSFTRLQSQDGSSIPRKNLYSSDNIQQRSNNYDRVYQNQPSVSEISLQQEIEQQQQQALKDRWTNQLIQNEAYKNLIAESPVEISSTPIRRVSNSYVNSLPIQTLLQRAKTVESVPVRSKFVQQPSVFKEQTPILLDELRQAQLGSQSTKIETGSQAAEILSKLKQSLEPISFTNEQIIKVPQGSNVVINDPRIKKILNEVKAAREKPVSAPQITQGSNVQQIAPNYGFKRILSETKTPPQATVVSSQQVAQGVNPQILPGSLKDIFSQLKIGQGVVKSPGITATATTVATKPVKTPPKKRYLVIHPNGAREYVENLNSVVKGNPNYVLYTTENKTQTPVDLLANTTAVVGVGVTQSPNATKHVTVISKPGKPVITVATAFASSGPKTPINGTVVTRPVTFKINSTTPIPTKNITLVPKPGVPRISINGTVPTKLNSTTPTSMVKKNITTVNPVNIKPVLAIATAYASVPSSGPKRSPNGTITTKTITVEINSTTPIPTTKRNVTIITNPIKPVVAIATASASIPPLLTRQPQPEKPIKQENKTVTEIITYKIDPITNQPKNIFDILRPGIPGKPGIPDVKWPTIEIEEITTTTTTAKPANTTTTTSSVTTPENMTTEQPTTTTTSPTKSTPKPTTNTSTTTAKPITTTTTVPKPTTTSTTTRTTTSKPTTTTTTTTAKPITTTTTTPKPTTTTTTTTAKPITTTTTTPKPTTTTTTTTAKPITTTTTTLKPTTTTTTTRTTTSKPTTTTTTTRTTTSKPTTTTTTTSTTTSKPTSTNTTAITTTTKPTTTITTTTAQPTTTTTTTTPQLTTLKPNATTTTTTEQPTTTTRKPNSTHPHHLTAYRVGGKKSKKPVWFETNVDGDIEELLDKVTDEDVKYDVVYIFEIPARPVIDRDVTTTIHPNGTIIEETIETVWEDENDNKPKLIRTLTVVHPEQEENTD